MAHRQESSRCPGTCSTTACNIQVATCEDEDVDGEREEEKGQA